jgi:hypothetical protein
VRYGAHPREAGRVTRALRNRKKQIVQGGLTRAHEPVRVLPDWISYRHSLANVDCRQARGETVAECPGCECEVDVAAPAHSPKCGVTA